MNKIKSNILRLSLVSGTVLTTLLVASLATQTVQAATINSQLEFGNTGSNVTQLQQFLAADPFVYPAALVTGYYGPLTEAAVVQFQAAENIDQVGNVGSVTLAKINSIISSGLALNTSNPSIYNVSVQVSSNSATISWVTNESVQAGVYYSTSPITADEATFQYEIPYVSGTLSSSANWGTSNSVTIQGLQPNTTYYYVARSTDASGNMSQTMPHSFQTN